jgi:ATP-dependent DNA ligase
MCDTVNVFDLLYLNGQALLNRSAKLHKRNLKVCIKGVQGRMIRIEPAPDFEARTSIYVQKWT